MVLKEIHISLGVKTYIKKINLSRNNPFLLKSFEFKGTACFKTLCMRNSGSEERHF